jgi:hypothetical protein
MLGRHWWLTPVTLATQEEEIGRIMVWSQLGQIVCETLSQKKNNSYRKGLVEWLEVKALSLNPSTTKGREGERRKEGNCCFFFFWVNLLFLRVIDMTQYCLPIIIWTALSLSIQLCQLFFQLLLIEIALTMTHYEMNFKVLRTLL